MKEVEEEPIAKEDPRRMSAVQLTRLGVELLNRYDLVLKCMVCGETWSPHLDHKQRLAAAYWHCPNKCNV